MKMLFQKDRYMLPYINHDINYNNQYMEIPKYPSVI